MKKNVIKQAPFDVTFKMFSLLCSQKAPTCPLENAAHG